MDHHISVAIYKSGSWEKYADDDMYSGASFYEGRLLEWPTITERLPDDYYGIQQEQSVSISLDNADKHFTNWYSLDSTGDFRNAGVRINLYEGTTQKKFYGGKITEYRLTPDRLDLTVTLNDRTAFQKLHPAKTLTTDVVPTQLATVDMGKTIPVVWGRSNLYPIYCMREDTTANEYYYLLSQDKLSTQYIILYRDTALIDPTTYIVVGADNATNPYPGYTVAKFSNQQVDISGNHYQLYGHNYGLVIDGASNLGNAPLVIQGFLTNSTAGLGVKTDTLSFASASTQVDTAVNTISYAGKEQRPAYDVLNEMLDVAGGMLSISTIDSSGEAVYRLDVDYNRTPTTYVAGAGGYYDNIVGIQYLSATPVKDKAKSIRMLSGWNPWKSDWVWEKSIDNLHSYGVDKEVIMNARQSKGYALSTYEITRWARRHAYRDRRLQITCNEELYWANLWDIITVDCSHVAAASTHWQVVGLTRRHGEIDLELELYSTAVWSQAYTVVNKLLISTAGY